MSNEKSLGDNAQIMHSIGQLTGAVNAMHTGLTARIEDIRSDVRRLEAAQGERMDRIEDSLGKRIDALEASVGKRIDSLGNRVTTLENEDKRQIEKTAKLSAMGGGIGGALATVAVELIKRAAS
ncbi:conserved hypothethical protein (plasmid) [Ralstonia solanacearum CMR15]|nr:conserved hypothethical protein [Ralstonia solanacearum CMR15]